MFFFLISSGNKKTSALFVLRCFLRSNGSKRESTVEKVLRAKVNKQKIFNLHKYFGVFPSRFSAISILSERGKKPSAKVRGRFRKLCYATFWAECLSLQRLRGHLKVFFPLEKLLRGNWNTNLNEKFSEIKKEKHLKRSIANDVEKYFSENKNSFMFTLQSRNGFLPRCFSHKLMPLEKRNLFLNDQEKFQRTEKNGVKKTNGIMMGTIKNHIYFQHSTQLHNFVCSREQLDVVWILLIIILVIY